MSAAAPHRVALALLASCAITLAVGALGAAATASSVSSWYPTLSKPAFNPPNWVFGPVWTALYLLMGIAAWRVYGRTSGRERWRPLGLHGLQLALNLGWSILFFGLRAPALALADLCALLAVLAVTIHAFWRVDRLAGALLVPYLLWSSFALLLNFEICRLNAG